MCSPLTTSQRSEPAEESQVSHPEWGFSIPVSRREKQWLVAVASSLANPPCCLPSLTESSTLERRWAYGRRAARRHSRHHGRRARSRTRYTVGRETLNNLARRLEARPISARSRQSGIPPAELCLRRFVVLSGSPPRSSIAVLNLPQRAKPSSALPSQFVPLCGARPRWSAGRPLGPAWARDIEWGPYQDSVGSGARRGRSNGGDINGIELHGGMRANSSTRRWRRRAGALHPQSGGSVVLASLGRPARAWYGAVASVGTEDEQGLTTSLTTYQLELIQRAYRLVTDMAP